MTELPLFQGLPLPELDSFVIGGHDIRTTSFAESAEEFRRDSGVFAAEWISACRPELAAASERVRPGTLYGAGRTISDLGTWAVPQSSETARQAAERIAADLAAFVESEAVDHLIVLNVASTEPPFEPGQAHERWGTLLFEGIAGIGAAVATWFWPHITVLVLIWVIAAWALVTGIFEIVAAIRLRKHITGEWLLALAGIVSVIFGVILIGEPAAGVLAIAVTVSVYALLFGIVMIALGLRLRSWTHRTA